MTVKTLKEIISNLPDNTIILIHESDINEVETVEVQYHSSGKTHLVFSTDL